MMIEILTEQFYLAKPFFSSVLPNYPVVMGVLERNNTGRVWFNNLICPTCCLVIATPGYSFIGHSHNMSRADLGKVIKLLKEHAPVKLITQKTEENINLFKEAGFSLIDRIEFINPNFQNEEFFDSIVNKLPKEYKVESINSNLLKKSNWSEFVISMYGGRNNFLTKGFGFAITLNHEIVTEAFACYIGGGYVETGSVTHEKFRGKGFATIVRALLIKEILKRSLLPVTTCDESNFGSKKASMKLGYIENRRYYFLTFKKEIQNCAKDFN